jgi:hypothetical protein
MKQIFGKVVLSLCVAIVSAPMGYIAIKALEIALNTTHFPSAMLVMALTLSAGVSAVVFSGFCLVAIWRKGEHRG